MVCSIDGINVQPNSVPQKIEMKRRSEQRRKRKRTGSDSSNDDDIDPEDRPHVDRTGSNVDIFECIQGQAVLTNTSASFRCTPKSHLHFEKVMDITGLCQSSKNFGKFSLEHARQIKQAGTEHEAPGCVGSRVTDWQIPIPAKKGSFILWFSTTIHSAQSSSRREQFSSQEERVNDPFKGWRGVVYVCFRPIEDFTLVELERRNHALTRNRCMNHWSQRENPVRARPRAHCDKLEWFLQEPTRVWDVCGKPSAVKGPHE